MNLAVNARDAMSHGGKLTIEIASADQACLDELTTGSTNPYVMLSISDNGEGMDQETQARMFEPFFTTKEPGKGTGLGLSTVYGIVQQSGGFIQVHSELGRGTTFKIYFPRVEGETDDLPGRDKEEIGKQGVETLLLVEDEAALRALTGRILRDRGYTVLEAPNGNEALRTAQEFAGDIHLVITDVIMPGMGGAALACQMDAVRPGIKVLFISGYPQNEFVHDGELDPGITFLSKPFTANALARKVRQAIDSTP